MLAVPKPHMISFGKWTAAKWYVGPKAKAVDMKIRALYRRHAPEGVHDRDAAEVTDRLFVVRRMFRLNDTLPSGSQRPPRVVVGARRVAAGGSRDRARHADQLAGV